MPTVVRYLVFQLPSWALVLAVAWSLDTWTELPRWLLVAGCGLFVAKDVVLYPFVRAAYEHTPHDPGQHLAGALGRVVVALEPEGWVEIGAERWRARSPDGEGPVEVGAAVRVRAMDRHTLVVARASEASGQP